MYILGKGERLKSRKAIEELFASGKKLSLSFYLLYFQFHEERKEPLQFGVGVSARQFRKAVARNRVKRLTREAYRLQKNQLKQLLINRKKSLDVFFIYTGKIIPQYEEAYSVIGSIIKKLENMLE